MRELVYMPRLFGRIYYPDGLPLYYASNEWQGNAKDILHTAVCKYYGVYNGGSQDLTYNERQALFEYVVYHINAPIWDATPGSVGILELLRKQADEINSIEKLEDYLLDALEAGLDPL